MRFGHVFWLLSVLICWSPGIVLKLSAAEPVVSQSSPVSAPVKTGIVPHFNVQTYVIEGKLLLATNITNPLFSKYTGTNVSLEEIVRAASDLQSEYRRQGHLTMNIVIAQKRITNGIVTMDVFPGAVAQVVMSGIRYLSSSNGVATALNPPAAAPVLPSPETSVTATNPAVPSIHPDSQLPIVPDSPEEMAQARAAVLRTMAELTARENDTRVHVVSTNAGPRFTVENYLVMGNTVLSPKSIATTLTNIDGDFGTNVSFDGIRTAVTELQGAYRERGYVTVSVGLPEQKLTNATVKVQVTEGRLAAINVTGNHYFSSNNVMRALPSLHTNLILNRLIFESELNRANANQDRQIYPAIGPGPDPGTSELTLKVKDRLPLHAKIELNNESSPGTPGLRLNTSFVYDNLWNLEHSFGFQYGFSPEVYKSASPYAKNAYAASTNAYQQYPQLYNSGNQWNFYDLPLVANYSTFYRMPLGAPVAIEDVVASHPGSFGYDEATRKFNVPPPSGQPELTFFASRATIDTGLLTTSPNADLGYNSTNNESLVQNSVQQDLTVNNDLGFRLNIPLPATADFHASVSGGLDYKDYNLNSYQINGFTTYAGEIDYINGATITNPIVSSSYLPVPITISHLDYLPVSLRYDAGFHDAFGNATFGLGLSANTWFSATVSTNTLDKYKGISALQTLTSSTKSTGYWVIVNPSFSQDFVIQTNWILTVKADGQWASEPLISNEQFGAGGVNSVRGYQEGEVFGDTGWHVSLEQQTPPQMIGTINGTTPLIVRGSVYTDYARTFLLDPQGRTDSVALWGAGFGGVASIGSHWEARFLFSVPLLGTTLTAPYHPFFNFSLTAQF